MAEKVQKRNTGGHGPGGGMSVGEKSNDFKKTVGDFFKYIGKYKVPMILSVCFAMIGTILNLVGPNRIQKLTQEITNGLMSGGIDLDAITKIAIGLIVLYSLGFILNYVQGFIMATLSQRITQKMRRNISNKINVLPLRYFDSNPIGDILSRITNDVDTVGQTMNQSLSSLVTSVTLLVGSAIMMFYTNWTIAIAGIAAAFIGMFFMVTIIKSSQKHFMEQQVQLGQIDGHIEEMYSGHSVVKAYNGEAKAAKEFHDINEKLYNSAWKSQFMSGLMMPLMMFIGNFAFVVVCVLGALLIQRGTIEISVMVAFMMYIRLFTQPLQQIAQAATSMQRMAAASERVFAFLGESEMENEDAKTKEIIVKEGQVEFEHVKFGYLEDKVIIHDFSAKVKPGQKVAIVGPTGAGKTTMVNLLMRFYELNEGKILIDGTDIKSVKRDDLHKIFGMVLQDTWLFEGTIRENIIYGKENITDERLDEVCKATGLSDLIAQEPEGYDTVLNDQVSLSAGQKQLITIARAMIEDAPLLILDEATSSVDTRTELQVQSAMDQLTVGRTSFVIAHRLSTIKNADVILVMKDGDIIESGNHNELLAKNGFYADLYNSQFENAS